MSYFDDASLVMIPSGYKTSKVYSVKPTDGSGDLTFSRSNDTATRVGPDGLIEKVRTQQYFKSTAMITSSLYTIYGVTPTSLGTYPVYSDSLAYQWLNAGINQGASFTIGSDSAPRVFSFFAKDFGALGGGTFYYTGGGGQSLYGFTTSQVINGYTRIYVPIPAGTNGTIFCRANDNTGGTFYLTAPQIEYGDYPTAYISNDTTASVITVGPVANVPRLDYLNSSCPRLLLEPQRTNLLTYSEQFNNAAYILNNATITANSVVSPDGYTNADTYTAAGSNNYLNAFGSSSGSNTITYSVFVKAGTQSVFRIREAFYFGTSTIFNLSTGTVTSGTGTITSYGNGWYRCTMSQAYGAGQGNLNIIFDTTASSGTFYLYGAQAEVGAYATSYIPTLGAAVTRGADACSKTGISSLIGQTEGTLFVDFVFNNYDTAALIPIVLTNTSADQVYFLLDSNGQVYADFYFNASFSARISTSAGFLVKGTRYKMALVYKENDFAFYINGQQIGTDNSGIVRSMTSTYFVYPYAGGYGPSGNTINQALLFKTRLSNSSLAELTSL